MAFTRSSLTPVIGRFKRPVLLAAALGLSACGTFVEPKPGKYLGLGQTESDLTCEYGAPTAMVISTWRCRRTADMPGEAQRSREFLESRQVHQPRDP